MNKMVRKTDLGLMVLLLFLSACAPPPSTSPLVKANHKGTSTKTPFLSISTYTATPSPAPSLTASRTKVPTTVESSPTGTASPSPQATDTETTAPPTSTWTPDPPTSTITTAVKKAADQDDEGGRGKDDSAMVKVSVTTNCRTGPGVNYPKLTALQAGKKAALVGRNTDWTYWIINDPGKTGKQCWLWGYYASTTGNTKNLKVYQPPAPPGGYPTTRPKNTPTSVPPSATKPPSKTPKPTKTSTPSGPTPTPNLTPNTSTHTSPPPTSTPIPPSATPIPDPGYCPYTSVLPGEEEQIRNLINEARKKHGLPKLKNLNSLVTIARNHGRDMTCHGTYSHTSTDGTKAWQRISVALGHGPNWCYNHCCCSEIFYGGGSPQKAFNWWMTHPSQDPNYKDNIHKRTILSKYSTHMGVGAIYYKKGNVVRKYYTVDFARP